MASRVKKKNKCATPGCHRPTRSGKSLCTTCDKNNWRKKYPMKAAFQTLRHNSTRRGIYFDLTFDEFKELCYETDYMAGKGRTSTSYSLDRIVEGKKPGYTKSNIQVLPVGVNTQKEHARRNGKVLVYDWQTKSAIYVDRAKSPDEENPF